MTEIADPHAKWAEWVQAGLISAEQVRAIGDYEQARAAGSDGAEVAEPAAGNGTARGHLVGAVPEALGYLGGLLVLGGSVAFLSRVWDEVPLVGRVAIAAVAAVILGVGGMFVDERLAPARARLRAVLWTASTAATGIAVGLLAAQGLADPPARTVVVLVALSVGLQAGVMWAGRDRPVQMATHLVAWPVVTGAAVAHVWSTAPQGLVIWMVGAVIGWWGLYRVTGRPVIWVLVGAGATLVGAGFVATAREGIGLGFALATAVGVLTLGMWRGAVTRPGPQLAVAIIGGVSTLQLAPTSLGYFSGEAGVLTGAIAWAAGAAVLLAVFADRLRAPKVCEPVGAAVTIAGAAVMATQVTAVALAVGLGTAVALIVIGTRPERVGASVVGVGGLLVFVPWTISHFFPGEGRVPVLVTVTGLLILAVSLMLLRRRK